MSQRNSLYARKRLDLYETPAWVVAEGLAPHFPVSDLDVCDPCSGRGAMVEVLERLGARVHPSDIKDYARRRPRDPMARAFLKLDFLKASLHYFEGHDAYVINPPYGKNGNLAEAFIRRGLQLITDGKKPNAWLAVLLKDNFDSAVTRAPLFEGHPNFRAAITLRRRIEWFKRAPGDSGPSENHAWFVWRAKPREAFEPPWKLYAPKATLAANVLFLPFGQHIVRQMRQLDAFRASARSHGILP